MKALIAAVLLSVLLALSSWYFATKASTARAALEVAQNELVQAKARTAKVQAQVQKATTDAQRARTALKDALNDAPAFRDTPVPQPVRDSLCSTLRCK